MRPRLAAELAKRFDLRLLIVVGGAGFGKSTLLAQAIVENAISATGTDIWLGLGPEDTDFGVLFAGLARALGSDGVRASSTPAEAAAAVSDLVWQRSPREVAIILDDVHELGSGSSGVELIRHLVRQLPANGHLVFASRVSPPVDVARLAAQGRLGELGEPDLAFAPDELVQVASSRGTSVELLDGTAGWPALVELTLHHGLNRAGAFLWEELLSHLPADRRRLLAVITAIGGSDDELLSAIGGGPVSVAEVTAGLPMVATGPDGWRRLHELWGPVLARELPAADIAEARERAADVLARRGERDAAIRLYGLAGCSERMLALVRDACIVGMDAETPHTLRGWLAAMPVLDEPDPLGLLLEGIVAKPTDKERSAALLEAAIAGLRERGDAEAELTAIAHRGHLLWRSGDLARIGPLFGRVLELETQGVALASGLAAIGRAVLAETFGEYRRVIAELEAVPAGTLTGEWSSVALWLRVGAMLGIGDQHAAASAAEELARASGAMASLGETLLRGCRYLTGEAGEAELESLRRDLRSPTSNETLDRVTGWARSAIVLANRGYGELAGACLARTQEEMAGSVLVAAPLAVIMAQAALDIAAGEEAAAAAALAEAMKRHPMTAPQYTQMWRAALPISYVLVPGTRPIWDRVELTGFHLQARRLAQAVVRLRDGGSLRRDDIDWSDAAIVRAMLPGSWLALIAVAGVELGVPGSDTLVEHLGAIGRNALRKRAAGGGARAVAARRMLAERPATPAGVLTLDVLGPLELRRDNAPVTSPVLRRQRVREILCYLVVQPRSTREMLREALWPDLDDASASENLRVNLAHLARLLEPDRSNNEATFFVRSEANVVTLAIGAWLRVDAFDFEADLDGAIAAEEHHAPAAALEAYERALARYRGPFVADAGSADWALRGRQRVAGRYVRAATRAGELLIGMGRPEEAWDRASRALAVDPWAEPAHRLLVTSLTAAGDRTGATKALTVYREVLAELGVDGGKETFRLARAIATR